MDQKIKNKLANAIFILSNLAQNKVARKVQVGSEPTAIITSWPSKASSSGQSLFKLSPNPYLPFTIPLSNKHRLLRYRLAQKCPQQHQYPVYNLLQDDHHLVQNDCATTLSFSLTSTIAQASSQQASSSPSLSSIKEPSSDPQPVSIKLSSHLNQTTSSNQKLFGTINLTNSLSLEPHQNANKNFLKIHRPQLGKARKIIAFQELIASKHTKTSRREASALLGVANSTMQSWINGEADTQASTEELDVFFSTPTGIKLIKRIMFAVYFAIRFSCGGVRGIQECLRLSGLNKFIASSKGALQAFSDRCEEYIIEFGKTQEAQRAKTMKQRKITAVLDEMFRKNHPCLVAIDVVSNFILLEKFTKDRKAETWIKELKPRLDELNVEAGKVVSDLCGAIRASAGELGAEHTPELFHAQREISKGTSAPLAAKERAFEKSVKEAETKLEKAVAKHGETSEQAKQARSIRDLRKLGLEKRKERRLQVRAANKELSNAIHPIDLATGKLQTADKVKSRCDEQFNIIEAVIKKSGLSKPCHDRIQKSHRAFEGICKSVSMFFNFYTVFTKALDLETEQETFFNDVVFPLSYLNMIWKRLTKARRKELQPLMAALEAKAFEGNWSSELKEEWMKKGKELAESFQRSSSCVEGRNGMLSLYFHRFHQLNERSLKALTVIHNFHIKRSDQTTAAERFFGSKHDNLFESLVDNVRIPGKPQKQHHDLEKRRFGRLKCKSA